MTRKAIAILAKRRANLIDLAATGFVLAAVAHGYYWRAAAVFFIGALISTAAERGAWASNDADAESLVDRLEARGRMDAASEIAAAIRARGKGVGGGD